MSWKWYGVKTLYRTRAVGRPHSVDQKYDRAGTLVEERVVLIRARTFDEAILKAETEAESYANIPHGGNAYGQRVMQRYLGACDAFELFDPPAPGREVYSATRVASGNVTDQALVRQFFGPTEQTVQMRRKFLDSHLGSPSKRGKP